MNQASLRLYDRMHNIADEIDNKESELANWQICAVHDKAKEIEDILAGTRRALDRRSRG